MTDIAAQKEALKGKFSGEDLEVICFKGEPLDDALERFLQARKFDIEAAATQIQNAVRWRREFARKCVEDGKAACLGADIEEVTQFYRGNYAGHCKEGRPIWYEQTGNVDIPALHCLTKDSQFIRYHVCLMEELQDKYAHATATFGKTVNKTLSIIDLQGVTMSKLSSETLEFVKAIAKVDSDNYPETMGKMFIINSPSMFSFAWSMIQGFIDPRTASKIELLGGPEEWKPKLLALIDEDQLPAELGGTGPACLPSTPVFKEVSIASGTDVRETLDVSEGDKVKYKFFTRAGGNITFKIVFQPQGGTPVEVLPAKDYPPEVCSNSHNVSGEIDAPGTGQLVAVWEHPGWWSRQLLFRFVKL